MDTNTMILVGLAVLALVVLGAWAYGRSQRRARLTQTFGSEYDHAVAQFGGRSKAEAELAARERRFEKAHLRPLSAGDRDRFMASWQQAQARFVDSPTLAIDEADRLIEDVMRLRGYPVGDPAQRLADVAIGHAHLLDHYRGASEIAGRSRGGGASTEDLRQAMVHYRTLFEDLLEFRPEPVARRA